jgi:hypothetical protein
MKNLKIYSKTAGVMILLVTSLLLCLAALVKAQTRAFENDNTKKSLAILSIDTKGISTDAVTVRNMVQLEVEKSNIYSVMDKYDIEDILRNQYDDYADCYGKTCLVSIGNTLKSDKMLTGNIERFGQKLVITFRLIDVKKETIETVEAGEFLNLEEELQKMIRISINDLLHIENDQNLVNLLVDYDAPISSPKTMLRLNGPRMGVSLTTGLAGERLQAPEQEGGYDMFPIITQFGYQWETQYLSAGNFQALIEFIGMIGGLESGKIIPSIAVMNGFRSSANGWEFAFGPVFKIVQTADGYFDEAGDWHLEYEWDISNGENTNLIQELPDNRGTYKFKTNLIIGVGRTFKSGYLNIPVNLYVIPNKKGTVVGASMGFNINKIAR